MKSKHLKFGLPFLCVGAVAAVALFAYAGAVQNAALAAVSTTDRSIPVDCSFARGTEGKDFMRDGQEAHCRMTVVSFRRLYPEIAQHVDESSWR
jgi:hypothetical protein